MSLNSGFYRPDIDGLRALAVLSVVLYHAGFEQLSGGFVGVDIFFVISGYLITSLIYRELRSGKFSFKNFWMRRIRRILPASLFVMAFTVFFFAFIYPPNLYKELGSSLVAQSLFSANILFWLESGYFDTSSELKPLLHTWSLAVEEQFYFLFPPLLYLLFRVTKRHLLLVIFATCIVSLWLSVWGSANHPIAAFYLLPSRAWELGVGALLAIWLADHAGGSSTSNNLISTFGLLATLYSIFAFTPNTPFPSWYALVPTLGTAAIIYGNRNGNTILAKFFSIKPVVAIGLISYSLYLWHWPILVANRWMHVGEPSTLSLAMSVLLAVLLATASYFLIEQPVRRNYALFTNRRLLLLCCASFLALLSFGVFVHQSGGYPNRSEATKILGEEKLFALPGHSRHCADRFKRHPEDFVCQSEGYQQYQNDPFFIWGDSHANAMIPAFQNAAFKAGIRFKFATHLACPPILGLRRLDRPQDKCHEFNEAVFRYLLEEKIQTVFLVWRQNFYAEGREKSESAAPTPVLTTSDDNSSHKTAVPPGTIEESFNNYKKYLLKTIDRLNKHHINVFVVRQVPNFEIDPAEAYTKYLMMGRKTESELFNRSRVEFEVRSRKNLNFFQDNQLQLVDFSDQFCDEELCYLILDEKLLYSDDDHIGYWGASLITPDIIELLRAIYPAPPEEITD